MRATDHPEFDAWRWNDYWVPLDAVVEFKRGVYELALTELARYLPRNDLRNRFLRQGARTREQDFAAEPHSGANMQLPPGGSYEPDPQAAIQSNSGGASR